MLTQPELDAMRDTITAALPDTCVITRPAAGGTLDPVTGIWTPAAAAAVYTGACRVRQPTTEEFEKLFGDTQVTEVRYIGTLPHDSPVLAIGDRWAVTVSSDPQLLTAPLRVTRIAFGSWHLGRRVGLEIVV